MSGKRVNKSTGKKPIVLLVSLALVVTAVLGVTIAYLTAQTNQVKNTFTPGEVKCEVVESGFVQGISTKKEKVTVKNAGDTGAYIRAAIVVTWQKADGTVYAQKPVLGKDYSLDIGTGWTEGTDGYYYYIGVVPSGSSTANLINSCEVLAAAPAEGYTLHVEILAQAIQSSPEQAVNDAWGTAAAKLVKGGAAE